MIPWAPALSKCAYRSLRCRFQTPAIELQLHVCPRPPCHLPGLGWLPLSRLWDGVLLGTPLPGWALGWWSRALGLWRDAALRAGPGLVPGLPSPRGLISVAHTCPWHFLIKAGSGSLLPQDKAQTLAVTRRACKLPESSWCVAGSSLRLGTQAQGQGFQWPVMSPGPPDPGVGRLVERVQGRPMLSHLPRRSLPSTVLSWFPSVATSKDTGWR